MAGRRRYFSAEDEETGITPAALKRLGRERQKQYMRYWFRRNFEDPANETPWMDGEYQYIWGGPYDARDELYSEFEDLVPEDRIDVLVTEVERGGISDWAPGPDHPDHRRAQEEWDAERGPHNDNDELEKLDLIIAKLEAGLRPSYGDVYELERRREVLERLDTLKRMLMALAPVHGKIGHNKPPPDEEKAGVRVLDEVRDAAEVIGKEFAKSEPDVLQIAKATSRLQTALGWLGKKVDVAVESFAKGVGGAAGKVGRTGRYGSLRLPPRSATSSPRLSRVSYSGSLM
jgi:hypothetical protein